MGRTSHLAAAVTGELDECSRLSSALIDASVSLSEREVMAVASSITTVKQDAREHAESLMGLQAEFEGTGSDALSAVLAAQGAALREYMRSVQDGLDVQHQAAVSALDCAKQIKWLAMKVQACSQELAMLTLNARIESARAGASGAAFATIADSMRTLSAEVNTANARVSDLAGALNEILPTLELQAREQREKNGSMVGDIETHLANLTSAFTRASTVVTAVVRGGANHATGVVKRAGEILSRLQFQDRMAQTLRELEGVVRRTSVVTSTMLEALDDEEADAETVARALAEARRSAKSASVRLSGESELNSSDRHVDSGEVMLF